jgi:hypothetical protein
MTLLECYSALLGQVCVRVFGRKRTARRAFEHAVLTPLLLGRRTLSRVIWGLGRQFQDWSADYRLFSRRRWQTDGLFEPVQKEFLHRYPRGPVPLALDDTGLKKTGKKIATARWQYDHMSPPFHANLCYGLRFLAAALLFPHHREGGCSARAYPIRFSEAPFVKKPGKRAGDALWQRYRLEKKQRNLSVHARELLIGIRHQFDALGAACRTLLVFVDASFCNQTLFRTPLDRIDLLARCRKDAQLSRPVHDQGQRRYSREKFTPEQVRQGSAIPFQKFRVVFAGARRVVRCKVVPDVLWQHGGRTRPLRLLVIAPRPYRPKGGCQRRYREPAYLLTTDCHSPAGRLLQGYHDRWEIEVNHRDEKSMLGVGHAQVRHPASVSRHPTFLVAAYSLLLLACLQCFGVRRNQAFAPLPKWRKQANRASLLDILTLLRCQLHERPFSPPDQPTITPNLLTSPFG